MQFRWRLKRQLHKFWFRLKGHHFYRRARPPVAFTSRSSPGDARECTWMLCVTNPRAASATLRTPLKWILMRLVRGENVEGGEKERKGILSNFKSLLMHARWPRFRECYKCLLELYVSLHFMGRKTDAAGLKSTSRDHARCTRSRRRRLFIYFFSLWRPFIVLARRR